MPRRPEPASEVSLAEARNLAEQFRFVRSVVASVSPGEFRLTSDLIRELHRIALDGLDEASGQFRTGRVFITNSEHRPPSANEVQSLVEEMCAHVNRGYDEERAVHLCAYVMWRLAWIHPFADGNGRTSRAAAYLVLSIALGYLLPGANTIVEQIAKNRRRYFEVLEDSDTAWRGGRLDLGSLERLIGRYLARQLESSLTPEDHPE